MSAFTYAILGSGRQGTAAGYDLARFGKARKIIFVDKDIQAAEHARNRINKILAADIAEAIEADISQSERLASVLNEVDVTLSAVPYYHNLRISKACIQAGSSLCDMGGHTETTKKQLKFHAEAKEAGVSIVPDCGMGPGLNITLAAFVKDQFDDPREIYIYDGGLPQNPVPPWNYALTFHINGLTNEMNGWAQCIRDGKVTPVETLTEPEFIEIEPVGKLEADITSGGLSTSPWSFEEELTRYENKTLRYPGHFEWFRAYKALGLFSEEAVNVGGQKTVPRQLFHTLLEPKIRDEGVKDICLIRVIGVGTIDSEIRTLSVDLIDRFDQSTGFTAMERLTGWHCAVMMGFQSRGMIEPGCHGVHEAIAAKTFLEAFKKRGIDYHLQEPKYPV